MIPNSQNRAEPWVADVDAIGHVQAIDVQYRAQDILHKLRFAGQGGRRFGGDRQLSS